MEDFASSPAPKLLKLHEAGGGVPLFNQ